MQSKTTEVITIRTTVTTTVKIERTTQEKESTTMPRNHRSAGQIKAKH